MPQLDYEFVVLKRCHKFSQGTPEDQETQLRICCPQTMPPIHTGHPRGQWDLTNNLLSSNDDTNSHRAHQRSMRLNKEFVVLKRCHKFTQGTPQVLETRLIILSSNDATNSHKAPQSSMRLNYKFVVLKRCMSTSIYIKIIAVNIQK